MVASEAPTPTFSSSFLDLTSRVQTAALNATRTAAGLPTDIQFHRSIDSEFAEDLDTFSSRVLALTNNLLSLVATADPSQSSRLKGKAKLRNQDDVVDDFHSLVVDSMDQLLERTDMCLDEFLGRNKAPLVVIDPDAPGLRKTVKNNPNQKRQLDAVVQHASHLVKPQLSFKSPVDNSEEPWYSTLTHKFNAQVPLGYIYRDSNADPLLGHPYHYEITHISYPQRMFAAAEPIPPQPLDSTSAIWVSTSDALESMVDELRLVLEIAIDLEHNNYRSYAGIVCLMQISTRTKDWIVDTLALRAELATGALNEVFTDPKIIKVFHGAESDIIWLQQNFNIYIVNLFDTFHASKLLEFPRHGLANLLEMYCDFVPDKRYQLADWRIRPLPDDMLHYARSDTHFLLFIYDNLRNALLDRALSRAPSKSRSPSPSTRHSPPNITALPEQVLVRQVLARSEQTALRIYEKEMYDYEQGSGSGGWDTLARKWNKGALVAAAETPSGTETLQRALYRCVHAWRDEIARAEDESTRYVLPNHYLFQLAERPPGDMAALLQMFQSVPPVVRRRAKGLLDAIRACVQRHLSKSQETAPTPSTMESDVVMEVDTKMDAEFNLPAVGATNLWSITPSTLTSVAVKSTLFGCSLPAKTTLTASASALFGMKRTVPKQFTSPFQEVVARIHSALVIVPTMPVADDPVTTPHAAQAAEPAAHGMQIEVPYVHAAQRTTKQIVEVDDSIVVVGQPRVKKRKHAKADAEVDGGVPSTESLKKATKKVDREPGGEADTEAFDFSAVPNILDDVPNEEDMRVKKKKRQKKVDKPFYGNFPAPPKAHRDVKSGNQSHTFK